uniref:TNFR-Cys domain-containing protein n=1 Tax=Setaria viridis TaxID=4556 RepID=A0A4U6VHU8_SETVI|nr:hypothetical protein SEVIR_3G309500v2 [Setaria viridis]
MASTAAALNGALLAAVCFVLLHSSTGQQPVPASNCPDHAAPTPPPVPPASTPTPTPAPPPTADCYSSCGSQCNTNCTNYREAGLRQCDAQNVAAFNSCYDSCTSRTCPGKSCVHSGCGSGNCTCENGNARSCCEWCGSAISSAYFNCRTSVERVFTTACSPAPTNATRTVSRPA